MAFDRFSNKYHENGSGQFNAAKTLIDAANIKGDMSIMDVGCGSGKITIELEKLTTNKVFGIDISAEMIALAKKAYMNSEIEFYQANAHQVNTFGKFDLIFCNSVFHWLKNHDGFLKNSYMALNNSGVFALQVPPSARWCPSINNALDKTIFSQELKDIGSHYQTPWTYFDTVDGYCELFNRNGFSIVSAKVFDIPMCCSFEEIIAIFDSGSSAAYFDPNNYTCSIDKNYETRFRKIFMDNIDDLFIDEKINIVFKRLFLIAKKEKRD